MNNSETINEAWLHNNQYYSTQKYMLLAFGKANIDFIRYGRIDSSDRQRAIQSPLPYELMINGGSAGKVYTVSEAQKLIEKYNKDNNTNYRL